MSNDERSYLTCYDYGKGGLWWWIAASSPDDIRQTYDGVTVFEEPPEWWSAEDDSRTQRLRLGEVAPGLVKVR